MKNGSRKPRSGLIKKHYLTQTLLLGMLYNICVTLFSCKVHGLARRDFPASGGQPEAEFLKKHTRKPFLPHDLQLFKISVKLVQW